MSCVIMSILSKHLSVLEVLKQLQAFVISFVCIICTFSKRKILKIILCKMRYKSFYFVSKSIIKKTSNRKENRLHKFEKITSNLDLDQEQITKTFASRNM